MAKKKINKSIIDEEKQDVNNSINLFLRDYKGIKGKEKQDLIKKLKKEINSLESQEKKEQVFEKWRISFELNRKKNTLQTLLNKDDEKIKIEYGNLNLYVKESYLKRLKDKANYLENLYARKMSTIINNYQVNNYKEAKKLDIFLQVYYKKLNTTNKLKDLVIFNALDKLDKFQLNNISSYKFSETVKNIYNKYYNGKEIKEEELTYALVVSDKKLNNKLESIRVVFF